VLVFLIRRLGLGSPVDLPAELSRDANQIERIRQDWGLDQPISIQMADHLSRMLRGDLGRSWFGNTPIRREIVERFPATLELATLGMILGKPLVVSRGIISAIQEIPVVDPLAKVIALRGLRFGTPLEHDLVSGSTRGQSHEQH
jgi:peptide/nickel transport system permease protein